MDDQAFSTATLQAVTKEELETSSSYEPLKLKAVWDLQDYHFTYLASYGLDEYGNLNYLTEENGLIINNKVEGFTIDSFENGIISIPTTAEYKVGDSVKFMDGWYVGIDKSTGIRISSLTKEQFEKILEELNGETAISLYCEFTDNEYFNVVITDDKHQDKVISEAYLIEGGNSIISSGNSIPSFDTSDYDDDPNISYFFNGFIDDNNNVYTLEQLEQLEITSNMTFKVNWSEKFALKYDDGITQLVIPGTKNVTLRSDSEVKEPLKTDSKITVFTFLHWEINGEKKDKLDIPNQIGGEVVINAKYKEEYYYKLTITNKKSGSSGLNQKYQIEKIEGNFYGNVSIDLSTSSSYTVYVLENTSVTVTLRKLLKALFTESKFTVNAKDSSGNVIGSGTSTSTSNSTTFEFKMPYGIATLGN